MRIAFVVKIFPRLSETFILNQITGLIDRGHEVDIFAGQRGDVDNVHPDIRRYRLMDRARFSVPCARSRLKRAIGALRLAAAHFPENPRAIVNSLNVLAHGWDAASCRVLHEIIPFLPRKDYDIIQCHFGPIGVMGALLREAGVVRGRLVTAFHGMDMTGYLREHGDDAYESLFQKGDLFLPISERWKHRLVELGCDKDRTLVHHMGVDPGEFAAIAPSAAAAGHVKILTIARLVEKKGVEYAISAMARISRKYDHLSYEIIGDGPLRDRCSSLIAKLNVEDKVQLAGGRDHGYVLKAISNSHIFLSPSVTGADGDQEGVPVVLMEAMAAGLPVVSTRHSGIPELVQDGLSGFLVPERDVDALVEKLSYLVEHPEAWPPMGRIGRAQVEVNYDINKLNDRLVRIYEAILRGNGALDGLRAPKGLESVHSDNCGVCVS